MGSASDKESEGKISRLDTSKFSVRFTEWQQPVVLTDPAWLQQSNRWIYCQGIPTHRRDQPSLTKLYSGFGEFVRAEARSDKEDWLRSDLRILVKKYNLLKVPNFVPLEEDGSIILVKLSPDIRHIVTKETQTVSVRSWAHIVRRNLGEIGNLTGRSRESEGSIIK